MIWLIGILGFLTGFVAGIAILKFWLRDRTQEELMQDKRLHRRYGLFVWILAVASCLAAIKLYGAYF